MGNSLVLFDVSIVISRGQFHCGNIGHTQNTVCVYIYSGTATIVQCLNLQNVREDVCWPGGGGSAEMAAFSRKGSSWQDGWAAVSSMMQSE